MFLNKNQKLLQGFNANPNSGLSKTDDDEYSYLQNVRGYSGFGSKRRGVVGMTTLSYGIMGIFGDASSPDKILVYTQDGNVTLFDPTELTVQFEFLFNTTSKLILQSPNLDWWDITPDATTGIIPAIGVVAPASSLSADLFVQNNALFGFQASSTKIYRMFIDISTNPLIPVAATRQYGTASAVINYSTDLAFATGYGPVIQDNLLRSFRINVANGGYVQATQTA